VPVTMPSAKLNVTTEPPVLRTSKWLVVRSAYKARHRPRCRGKIEFAAPGIRDPRLLLVAGDLVNCSLVGTQLL
jgi:hypothetical protein